MSTNCSEKEGMCGCKSNDVLEEVKKVINILAKEQDLQKRYGFSLLSMLQGNYDDAAADLRYILKQQPRIGVFHRRLGELSILKGDYKKALPHFRKALKLNSIDFTALTWLTLSYYHLGNNEMGLRKQKELEELLIFMSSKNWS
jgi:tetratricopeptide (TPR) repeat protein